VNGPIDVVINCNAGRLADGSPLRKTILVAQIRVQLS